MPGLCSLNELKDNLRIPTAETILDTSLTALIVDVSAACEKFTERTFLSTGYANEAYDVTNLNNVLVLRNYPIDQLSTFQLKDYDATDALIVRDQSDYFVNYSRGIVSLKGGLVFSSGRQSVLVTFTAGYAVSGTGADAKVGVPEDLGASVSDYCKIRYQRKTGAIGFDEYNNYKKELEKVWYGYARMR